MQITPEWHESVSGLTTWYLKEITEIEHHLLKILRMRWKVLCRFEEEWDFDEIGSMDTALESHKKFVQSRVSRLCRSLFAIIEHLDGSDFDRPDPASVVWFVGSLERLPEWCQEMSPGGLDADDAALSECLDALDAIKRDARKIEDDLGGPLFISPAAI